MELREHSVTFGDGSIYPYGDHTKRGFARGVNTWDDWHLIPSSRPEIAPPEVYTNYVDLPAGHGKLDLSEYLTGGPIYKGRSGSFGFIVANDFHFWAETYSQMQNFLHGKALYMTLWDEPEYFYKGRFRVQKWNSDGRTNWSTVGIDYDLEPFKFLLPRDSRDQYWDRFLLDDLHKYEFMDKLDASLNPSFNIKGYSTGFMMDAFIDDSSTFPAQATITLNNDSMTISRLSVHDPLTWTGSLGPVMNSDNTVSVSGTGLVNLVCWGGQL